MKHEKLVAQIVKSNHSSHPDRIVKLESSRPPRKLHAFKMLIQRIRQYLLFDLQKAWNEGVLQTVINTLGRWKFTGIVKKPVRC